MTQKVITPAGRIVWGNPLESRPKVKNGQPVMKDGKQVVEYSFGLAIAKGEFAALGAALQAEAIAVCPQGVPGDFSFKMKDGDTGVDGQNRPLRDKPGMAGCYILACSTEYPIPCFKREGASFVQLTQGIKTGDFVRAELTINGHGRDPRQTGSKPGVYLNPNMVEFLGYGEEIRGGVNPNDAFGAPVANLPAGASMTPTATHAPPSAPTAPATPHTAFPMGGDQQPAPPANAPQKMPWE